jgi:hypothetical protein
MHYWGIPAFFVFLAVLDIATLFGPVGRDYKPGLYPALTIGVIILSTFFVASVKAVVGFSHRWSVLALIISCFLLLVDVSSLSDVMRLYPRLPKAALHLGFSTLLGVVMHICYLACFWRIWRLSDNDRRLCAWNHRVRFFPRTALRPLTVVPATMGFVVRHRLWTTGLIVYGAGFLLVVPYNLDRSQTNTASSMRKAEETCSKQPDRQACLVEKTTEDFLAFAIGLPIVLALCLLTGRSLLNAGGRRIAWSTEDLTRTDLGSPVLFLRSFRQDRAAVKSSPYWLLGRIIMFGQPRRTLDQIVLEEASAFGPLIALTDPSDASPQFGAARAKLGQVNWHDVITDAMSRASMIVIFLDETEGVRWEVEQIAKLGLAGKTLFLVPRSHAGAVENHRIVTMVLNQIVPALKFSDSVTGNPIVGFFFEAGKLITGRSVRFTSASYLLMIRWFLRARHSGTAPERQYPRAREPVQLFRSEEIRNAGMPGQQSGS